MVVTATAVATVACAAPRPPREPLPTAGAPPSISPAMDASADENAIEQERLAAIQHAMNELDEGAQLCWAAAAAVDGYQLAGDMALTIDIATPLSRVEVTKDNTKDQRLLACMRELLAEYAWVAPLHGQTIRLPFSFRAPSGQSVIDRQWVPFASESPNSPVAVAVLLDAQNTGNAAGSMFEIRIAAGASTQLGLAPRSEAWTFLSSGSVTDGRGRSQQVATGDMMLVAKNGVRKLSAGATALRAVLLVTPGGEETATRAGAVTTAEAPGGRAAAVASRPIVIRAATAKRYPRPGGSVQLLLDPTDNRRSELAASWLTLDAGASVPSHQHATETEFLYILDGAGTLTVGNSSLPVTSTSVLQLPPGISHSFSASAPLRAIQIYTPAGPEQRFKAAPPIPSGATRSDAVPDGRTRD
jgi:quercetin dioxygenase-like cupin family protein